MLTQKEVGKLAYRQKVFSGIYFLLDNNELVYVGVGLNCYDRIRNHFNDKQFNDFFIILCDYEKANILEKIIIFFIKPKYNIRNVLVKR